MNEIPIQWGASEWWLPVSFAFLAFVALVVWCYRRAPLRRSHRLLASALKIIAVLLLSLCLLEPLISGVRPRPGANIVAVVVDNSRSMQIEGRGLPTGDALRQWLGDGQSGWRARLGQDFDVRMYAFDRELRRINDPTELTWDSSYSNLSASLGTLKERFQDQPLAGVILVTDGNATDATGLVLDESWPFPVHVITPKQPTVPSDTRFDQVQVSQSYFETSPTTISANVVNHGYARKPTVVQLRDMQGKVLEQQTVETSTDGAGASVRFRFRPSDPGIGFYRIVTFPEGAAEAYASQSPGLDATWENNRRTLMVDRGGGPFRILYVSGRPNWEFKFLSRALQKDEELQLLGLLRIANKEPKFQFIRKGEAGDANRLFQGFDEDTEDAAEDYDEPVMVRIGVEDSKELAEGFPADAGSLFAYDAIIIDDLEASFFSPDQMLLLRRYVSQRGGALLMLGGVGTFAQGGYERTPIGEMLPVYLDQQDAVPPATRLSLRLTREGMLETWTRLRDTLAEEAAREQQLPSFETVNRVGLPKPGAVTVAEVSDGVSRSPAIVTQRFGKGRAGAILIGDLWRWSMRRENVDQDDLAMFWRQATRWLVSEVPPRVTVQVLPEGDGGPAVRIRVVVQNEEFLPDDDASVELAVERPDGQSVSLTTAPSTEIAGAYDAEFWPQHSGGYRIRTRVTSGEGDVLAVRDHGWVTAPEESEFQQLSLNDTFLSQLALSSKGARVDPPNIDDLLARLEREPVPITEHWVAPLWHQGWVLGLAIACLCGEWGLRRVKGLA